MLPMCALEKELGHRQEIWVLKCPPGQGGVWLIIFSVLVRKSDQRRPYGFWRRVCTALVEDLSLVEAPAPDRMPPTSADTCTRVHQPPSTHIIKIISNKELFIA